MNNELPGERAGVTRRLYFEDAYGTEFEARVVERLVDEGKSAVILDQTSFYPESGGQPADRGELGGVGVVDVREDEGRILHYLEKEPPAGNTVRGRVDWKRRFDHMQQHSGQHILSQAFYEVMKGRTMSFHLGDEVSTVEIGIPSVSEQTLESVEKRANEIVFKNLEIKTYFVDEKEIAKVPLRKPPQVSGLIRVVEVDGFDYSACGGTHCRRSGEIGLIKIMRWDKIRGNLRFEFLCGGRAWRDYVNKNAVVRAVGALLTAGDDKLAESVDKLLQENRAAKKNLKKYQESLAAYEARDMVARLSCRVLTCVLEDKSPEELRPLALNIVRSADRAVAFALRGNEQDRLVIARADCLAVDVRELVPVVMSLAKGKGGGSPSLVELILEKGADLDAILARIAEFFKGRGIE